MQDWIIRYWLEAVFGLIIAGLSIAYRKLSCRMKTAKVEQERDQCAIREGIKALLWDALYRIYHESIQAGFISIDGMKNAENIYKQYHALGGNGTGTEMYERICKLRSMKGE